MNEEENVTEEETQQENENSEEVDFTYTPTEWKDRIVQYPNRYSDQNANMYMLTQEPGEVSEEGTLVNAERLNNMEQGIVKAYQYVDYVLGDILDEQY